jgi:hypothetical protein
MGGACIEPSQRWEDATAPLNRPWTQDSYSVHQFVRNAASSTQRESLCERERAHVAGARDSGQVEKKPTYGLDGSTTAAPGCNAGAAGVEELSVAV